MCPIGPEGRSSPMEPGSRTRYGLGSLLAVGLAFEILIAALYLDFCVIENPNLGLGFTILSLPVVNAVFFGAGLLAIIGLTLARRGIVRRSEPRAASIFGLVLNGVLFLATSLYFVWAFRLYFAMPKVRGSFLINGRPVRSADMYLRDESTDPFFSSGYGAYTRKDGSFRIYGINPGDYKLIARIDLPLHGNRGTCASASSDFVVHQDDYEVYSISKLTVIGNDVLSLPPESGGIPSIDINVVCQLVTPR